MECEAELLGKAPRLSVVEALVETDMVRRLWVRPRPMHRNCLKRLPHERVIVSVGTVDDHAERNAAGVGQHGALDPALAAVGWIAAGFFPRPTEPSPSPHRVPAKSSRCRRTRRRPTGRRARMP